MQISFWKSIRNLVAAGLLGFGAMTAQAFDQQPTRLPSFDEVYQLNESTLVLGQTCTAAASCDAANTCGQAGGCGSGCDDDCDCIGNWRDNTQVWLGGESYKSIGDSIGITPAIPFQIGLSNSFGLVTGFNTGLAIGDLKVRAQIGGSAAIYDLKGRDILDPTVAEHQAFVTAGFYKRSDICNCDRISWGLVFDQFLGDQWGWAANSINMGQFRGIAGYALNESNEVGVWGTFRAQSDTAVIFVGAIPTPIHTVNQANTYWRHNWASGASTMAYVGAADKSDITSWLFGLTGQAPLNSRMSLYGNFVAALPSSAAGGIGNLFAVPPGAPAVGASELQWNVSFGLMYSFGGKAYSSTVSGQQGLPLLPVANNGSFLITN